MNYSTDLSVVKTELARELSRGLDLPEPRLKELRLRNAVHDVIVAFDLESYDPDTRSSYVLGLLVKYAHRLLSADEIELLVRISESEQ